MEVPRLEVESKLQLPAYITATAMRDFTHICDLHHRSWQHWIPDPLSEARNQTCIPMDISWIHFHCSTMGTPNRDIFIMQLMVWSGTQKVKQYYTHTHTHNYNILCSDLGRKSADFSVGDLGPREGG